MLRSADDDDVFDTLPTRLDQAVELATSSLHHSNEVQAPSDEGNEIRRPKHMLANFHRKSKTRFTQMRDDEFKDGEAAEMPTVTSGMADVEVSTSHPTRVAASAPVSASLSPDVYRADVDGLRAVAVIAVIVFHFNANWLPGGFVGVDIFFVISGFVVTGSLMREPSDSMAAFLGAFYLRRIKRLAPALVVVIMFTSMLMGLFLPPFTQQLRGYYHSGQLALIGWANVDFATLPTGYFDEGEGSLKFNPFTHCWSLGVEEQFYLLYPLLFYVLLGKSKTSSPTLMYLRSHPQAILAFSMAVSCIICAIATATNQRFAYYLLPSRFWQLMSGALLRVLEHGGQLKTRTSGLLLEILAAFLLTVALVCTPNEWGFPFPMSIPGIVGTLCIIASGSMPSRPIAYGLHTPLLGAVLGHRAFVYVGKLSYPLYLWHWPVIVLFRWTLRLTSPGRYMLACAVIAIGASFLYHTVEGIFRAWRPRVKWHSLLVLLPMVCGTALWLGLLQGPLYHRMYLFGKSTHASPIAHVAIPPLAPLARVQPPPPQPKPPTPTYPPTPPDSAPKAPPSPPAPPPSSPPPPSAPIPPSCSVRSYNPITASVDWPTRARVPSAQPLSLYSTHSERQCRCNPTTPTGHIPPPGATQEVDPQLPPCFLPTDPNDEPYLAVRQIEEALHNFPCFMNSFPGSDWTIDDTERDVQARVLYCLTPERAGSSYPQRALFLIGDSHAAAIHPAFQVAFSGAASIVWAAMGGGCGFVNIPEMQQTFDAMDECERHCPLCQAYNEAVFEALQNQLQPCDVVVVHNHREKFYGFGLINALTALQNVVKAKGASLVILGDTPTLPARGTYCIDSPTSPDASERCAYVWDAPDSPMLGDKQSDESSAVAYNLLAQDESTYFFDMRSLLCTDDGHCGATVPGTSTLAFFDDHHITTAAAMYLWPFLCSMFEAENLLG